ncbi:NmrA family protein [Paraphaeosphaeria minitans]|uniref:NmrA family protein n=1 Tax=Paraphaeosphaeria minitans TaxID=565426 RepID=A0A9P6GRR0_9PLEO|nr:NmrA family protein [Paraphaeosphaeria minitans]
MSKSPLVIRATGSRRKDTVKHLAKSGWNVDAFVSDPSAERAVALKGFADSVSLHTGSLDDAASVEAATLNFSPECPPGKMIPKTARLACCPMSPKPPACSTLPSPPRPD